MKINLENLEEIQILQEMFMIESKGMSIEVITVMGIAIGCILVIAYWSMRNKIP